MGFDNTTKTENNIMKKAMLLMLLLAVLLQGCGAILFGGAATGAAVIHDRRSAGTVLDDKNIQFKILSAITSDADLNEHSSLSATSYNYAVLLTGQAENASYRERLVDLARNTPMVKRVIDQIEIGYPSVFSQETYDAYLRADSRACLAALLAAIPLASAAGGAPGAFLRGLSSGSITGMGCPPWWQVMTSATRA